jgi:acyl-CoA dehydrogenase
MIKTYAEKHGDTWKIYGRKWFITGADGAAHFILARAPPTISARA